MCHVLSLEFLDIILYVRLEQFPKIFYNQFLLTYNHSMAAVIVSLCTFIYIYQC